MRRTSLIPLCLVALGPLALGGCSALENLGGGKKFSPDEFKIVSHSPLTMPPNAELRPPRPGEPRPQEVTPADQAKEALSPALAGRTQARAAGAGGGPPPTGGSEQALVAKAGPSVVTASRASWITTVPISAPTIEPRPPTIIIAISQIELNSENCSTDTWRSAIAHRPPAMPA